MSKAKKIGLAAALGALLVAIPFQASADVFLFLSNPAAGGYTPHVFGYTGGENGSFVHFDANLYDTGGLFSQRRLRLLIDPVSGFPSWVQTQAVLYCSGGTLSANSGGWRQNGGGDLTLTCPWLQTSQTGYANVDVW